MITNDILRRVRYALDLQDFKVREIFSLAGYALKPDQLETMFLKEEDEGFVLCPDFLAHLFFQGLIIQKRGKKDNQDNPKPEKRAFTNNDALWYIRIAFQFKDTDILDILRNTKVQMTKAELNAFFRKKDHPNYRICGDQVLRNFFSGLTARLRP